MKFGKRFRKSDKNAENEPIVCNMCGKVIEKRALLSNNFQIKYRFGWGSKLDGDQMELHLCTDCLDTCVRKLVAKCKINPVF